MRYYRGYYSVSNDYDVSSERVRKAKTSNGREVIVPKSAASPKALLCSILNPMLVALNTVELKRRCYSCYELRHDHTRLAISRADEGKFDSLMACEGCNIVHFCSSECKDLAGRFFHKAECDAFQRLAPKVPPNNLRAVLRLLFLRKTHYGPAQPHWDSLVQCDGQVEQFRKAGGKRWEDLVNLTQCAIEYSRTNEEFRVVLNIFCALLKYGIPLQDEHFEDVGIAMHPWMAKLSHSCEPNSVILCRPDLRHDGCHNLEVVPLRQMARDENITIAFVDSSAPLSMRRQELQQNHFFECKCTKCFNETAAPVDLPDKQQLAILGQVEELVDAAKEDNTRHMPIQRLRYAVHLLLTCSWPSAQHPFPVVLRKLVAAYINDQQYNLAFAFAVVLIDIHGKMFRLSGTNRSHPVRLAHLFTTVRLMDKIVLGEEWASQDLDLVSRDLNLVGWRSHWIQKLDEDCERSQSWWFPSSRERIYLRNVRSANANAGNQLRDDKQKRIESYKPLKELGDEVMEKLRRW